MSIFEKISQLVLGIKDTNQIDKISDSINRLKVISTNRENRNFFELIRSIYSDNSGDKTIYAVAEEALKSLGIDTGAITLETDRLARYKEYSAIVSKLPYMKRALKVLTQNIVSPEQITKQSLYVTPISEVEMSDEVDSFRKVLYSIINQIELEDYIVEITYNCLKYGDYFAEIVIVDDLLKKMKILDQKGDVTDNYVDMIPIDENTSIRLDYTSFSARNLLSESTDKKTMDKSIYVEYISPDQVVKIGDRFCLGYLVLPTIDKSRMIGDIKTSMERIVKNDVVNNVIEKILRKIQTRPRDRKLEKTIIDLKYTLARILTAYSSTSGVNIPVRFVPPELMQHFYVEMSEFRPYGTSVLYGSEFMSRLTGAMLTSSVIHRLNRAIERRLIRVDVGSSRNIKKYILQIKSQMNRRKFTIDNMGTVDQIPSALSSFEDIYIPIKNGRAAVEFDTLPPVGDLSSKMEDLKTLRDFLVSAVEVPPPYIGIEENIESKATLSQESNIFAFTILSYQKVLSNCVTQLLKKIVDIVSPDKSNLMDYVVVHFDQPYSVLMEGLSSYIGSVSSAIDALTELGLPKKVLLQIFIPQLKRWNIDAMKVEEELAKIYKGETEGEAE